MPERSVTGRSFVTRRAIEEIVRAPSSGATGSSASSTTMALGQAAAGCVGLGESGVRVRTGPQFTVDLRLTVAFGLPVAEVARQVDSVVRYALRRALDREPDRLTIHVGGMRYEPSSVPPAELELTRSITRARGRHRDRDDQRARRRRPAMTRRSCDGAGLLAAFRSAVANLEAHVDEVNALNVFPVPDGDTGSNMVATVRVALEEAEAAAGQPADRIAAAISFGALMGARGNSGCHHEPDPQRDGPWAGQEAPLQRSRPRPLPGARARRRAYAAVKKPVEGTILTVIREASVAAKAAAEQDDAIETVLAATVDAAEKAVAKTPSLLPILREAGVVDAGGQGLYRLFQGALRFVVGEAVAGAVGGRVHDGARPSTLVAHADEGFGYETMFLLQPVPGQRSRHRRDPGSTWRRSASRSSSPATPGRPRSTSTTTGRTT